MTESKELLGFVDFFKHVPDHRNGPNMQHPVEELMLVAFCGIIAGCEGWEDIELFAKNREDFLRNYLPFEDGIPSDDTLRRFFRVLDPKIFEQCFASWVNSFQLNLESKVVALDGKTMRGSFDGESRPLHLVSAFASEVGLVLGQKKVDGKSNEIKAIPELLELLDLTDAIVTIDAMGCQYEIAKKIRDKKADYLLALKGNQGDLHNDVKLVFENKPKSCQYRSYESIDSGHGRIETRICTVTEDIGWLKERHPHWQDLNSIIEIESKREFKDRIETEKRYYISSLDADAEKILEATRLHWGIENSLHWVLDVSFGEDQSRIRKGNAPQNMGVIRKSALNILRKAKELMPRQSIRRLRKLAGWDEKFLQKVLVGKF